MIRLPTLKLLASLTGLFCGLIASDCRAWDANGHRSVANLGGKLVAGQRAEREMAAILGPYTIADAAVWADCVKGVNERTFEYEATGKFPECALFETDDGIRRMIDFVRRNTTECEMPAGAESCHRRHHYTNLSIHHRGYKPGFPGTRKDDVVASITVAARALAGLPFDPDYRIKDKFEALALLVHYVGDLHQPLHVGALYLDAQGRRIEPAEESLALTTSTRGGNLLLITTTPGLMPSNMHALWDFVPAEWAPANVDISWVDRARAIAATRGTPDEWPALWAAESLTQAQRAYEGLTFGPRSDGKWLVTLPAGYAERVKEVQDAQLILAGAHLAELLRTVWP